MQKTCLDFIEKANKKKFNKKLKSKNENGSKEKDKTISMDPKKKKKRCNGPGAQASCYGLNYYFC
jgi:hypothetical protein